MITPYCAEFNIMPLEGTTLNPKNYYTVWFLYCTNQRRTHSHSETRGKAQAPPYAMCYGHLSPYLMKILPNT